MRYLQRSIDPGQQSRRWIDPRVYSLRLADVIAYLARHGWRRLEPDRKGLLPFQEPTGAAVDGRPVCPFVPDAEGYTDYGRVMFELVTGVAEFEERQATEVIDDILRLAGRYGANGTAAQPAGAGDAATA